MQDNEIILGRIYRWQELQQSFIVFIGKDIGIIGSFRMIRCFGDERNGTVILSVAALVAEPISFITGLFGYINHRS